MAAYLLRRILWMIPTLWVVSIVSFLIIQLPPGDFASAMAAQYEASGEKVNQVALDSLRTRYGLDEPVIVQYVKWMEGVLRGDFGYSFIYNRPISQLIWERLGLTVVISILTLLLTWILAFPVGIYSAVHRYTPWDYIFSFLGFVGLSIPAFMLALISMWISFRYFHITLGGLFSSEFIDAPWNVARLRDLLQHLWVPLVILGTSGTAGMIRILRANLSDELHKPYVIAARSRGLPEIYLLLKYPLRAAVNPFVGTIGWSLPEMISGETIVAIVLSLPTCGPLLLQALMAQDMYLAGAFILLLSTLTVIGTLISDLLLAWLDPRIQLE